jgi:radical SAM protein with 4Fe4S-binding SPASM domain
MKAQLIARVFNSEKTQLEDVAPLDTPYSVHIDICSICNFKCIFCFQSDTEAMSRKGYKYGKMSFELFQKITDDLNAFKHKIRKVKIGLHGEPTLHRELPRMISYMKSQNVTEIIELFTNASLLNPVLNKALIEAGLDRVNMSIEGLTSEKYKEVTGVAVDMEEFVANIRNLYEVRKSCKIYIKIVDINLGDEDRNTFFTTYGDICDEIFVENVVPQWAEINKFDVDTTGMYGQKVDRYKEVCPFPFMYLHFNFDGTTSPCTLDWGKEVLIGNVRQESALEIWQGKHLYDLQIKMLEKKRDEIPFCGKCLAPVVCCMENLDDHAEKLLKKMNLQRDNLK